MFVNTLGKMKWSNCSLNFLLSSYNSIVLKCVLFDNFLNSKAFYQTEITACDFFSYNLHFSTYINNSTAPTMFRKTDINLEKIVSFELIVYPAVLLYYEI